ncbi:peptidyl-dipeptidase Dcp [Mucilaginibacter polytrichastri]|uniref:Dipeptidyl carboxypeptidase n=1 Tax=Mucilaginibacter polytrichastri TaxID=1302689 RepID=A0A1Q6A3W7_9SPHI|nr:peptidyl-dipeptidase Dcp [Mucilaginibacter polytrichastri]OKS88692.1 Peptidyl-dipeptidase dcp [Mucilaginibacter polytrichastri]SFT04488.1 peptidyl-dipeptidase Dcp [Mucilaginibacter polytrichastri]
MNLKKLSCLPALALLAVTGVSCKHLSTAGADNGEATNPFFEASKLSLQAPDFTRIKDSDYQPALEEGMKQQQAEISKIADNTEAPTFENTLVAMEKSGQLLNRVNGVFNLVTSANTNPSLQKVQEEEAPKMAANNDAIFLNTKLFKRVQAIYQKRDELKLDPESKRLVEYYEQKFELAGANLSDGAKDTLKKYNQEEAGLSAKFTNMVLAANKAGALLITDKAELAGLSDAEIQAAADNAKAAKQDGKWLLSLQNTTQQPLLQSLSNRATRQKLFEASYNRAEKGDANDTRKTIARIAELHALAAKLLGFKSYADWKLRDQMAQSPEAVEQFLGKLIPAATAKAKVEAADIQAVIDQQKGGFKLAPWDWNYYAEQVRKAKYDLDEDQIKPYFELDKVLKDGVFYAANRLYGLTFKERKDLPVYQPDVRVFDVFDKDGSQLGIFYCDYFKRDNKNGGAWMSNIVGQSKLLNQKPVIYNVCNFTKPAAGKPALISADDAKTMFHEFGHGLHGLFANQQYPTLASPNTARDYVEFPSQFNEHWMMDPKVFAHFAVHYQTGAPMPQALVDKIKKAGTFNQGYALTEALGGDAIDMAWNTLGADNAKQDVDKFEATSLQKAGLNLSEVPPRYRSSYFLHIWSNGYAAGYYAYAWTEMLDDDAFSWFQENGGLTRANGQRFRDMILSKGNTENYGDMFKAFRGHNPDIKPMLVSRGLVK